MWMADCGLQIEKQKSWAVNGTPCVQDHGHDYVHDHGDVGLDLDFNLDVSFSLCPSSPEVHLGSTLRHCREVPTLTPKPQILAPLTPKLQPPRDRLR